MFSSWDTERVVGSVFGSGVEISLGVSLKSSCVGGGREEREANNSKDSRQMEILGGRGGEVPDCRDRQGDAVKEVVLEVQ